MSAVTTEPYASYATRMLDTTPQQPPLDEEALARCVDASFDCAEAATACAAACLSEDEPEQVKALARLVKLCMSCADFSVATARALLRGEAEDRQLLTELVRACSLLALACAEECSRHDKAYCRVCAEACRVAADNCLELCASV